MPKPIKAASVKLWICDSDRLHISMFDEAGEEIAAGALSEEDTVEQIFDLAEQMCDRIDAEDPDEEGPPDDPRLAARRATHE